MKLPLPWLRHRSRTPSTRPEKVSAAKPEPPIDVSEPRECIYKSFADHPGPCPRCGGPLVQSRQTYLVLTRHGERAADSFMVGGDFGWFCIRCPTVVVNPADVAEMLRVRLSHWDVGDEFLLAGIVDLDAIPEDKKELPLGTDENPIPLVEFTKISRAGDQPARRVGKARPKKAHRARKKRRKRRRRR